MSVSTAQSRELVDALGAVIRTARSYAHLKHEQLGASNVSLAILTRLASASARPGDLAEALCVNPSAISRALALLDDKGYVTRTPDPSDARAQIVSLAPAGEELLHTQHEAYAEALAAVFASWDEGRAGEVTSGLRDLERAMAALVTDLRHGGSAILAAPVRDLVAETGTPTDHPPQDSVVPSDRPAGPVPVG